MKKVVFAAVLAAGMAAAGGASAADLGGGYGGSLKDEPVYAPAPIWTGYYIGGHLGALWNDGPSVDGKKRWCGQGGEVYLAAAVLNSAQCDDWKKWDKHVNFDHNDDDTTLVGGVHVGYNWQSGASVMGVEGDVSFADGFDYLASLRARLGYAEGNLLIYLTGGIAFAGFDAQDVTVNKKWGNPKSFTLHGDDESLVGFVVGAGAEYKLRPNVSVGLEGLYYNFADTSKTWNWSKELCYGWKEYQVTEKDDNDLFVVRARLTYHFQDEHDAPLK
jgi:outer membrane immunogenic protein